MKNILLAIFIAAFFSSSSAAQATPNPSESVDRPQKAVLAVSEFADFQCPFCARQAADLRRLQSEYAGKIAIEFKHFPLPIHTGARAAHQAAYAAGDQGKFWEMHDLIFAHPGRLSGADFDTYADQLALDKQQFHRDMESGFGNAIIERDIGEGKKLGVSGTPTFVINGRKLEGIQSYVALKRVFEAELKGQPWGETATRATKPRADVSIAGAPSRGLEASAVTIVEFSDFQCPFCARAAPLLREMAETDPGKIRWVFKNFPLDFHQDSFLAHMAAMAAGEQGKFWEMHDLIFANQHSIKRNNLLGFAGQLKLDLGRFERDLDSPALRARVEADEEEGHRIGIPATPSLVVNGEIVTGFSEEKLRERVNRLFARLDAKAMGKVNASLPALDLSLGPADAPLKIEWYSDLGSPLAAPAAVALQQFLAAHEGIVRVDFRNLPLPNRATSLLLHEFVLAAAAQGRFWDAEALLLADARPKDRGVLMDLAAQLGLDQTKLWAEVDGKKYANVISADAMRARVLGINGTPTFMVGGKRLDGIDALNKLDHN